MCGIAGIISNEPLSETDRGALVKMNGALEHRGPDGTGQFLAERAAIAMRRLSIIDLAGGAQPIFNEDKTRALVANGEIYNFAELSKLIAYTKRYLAGDSVVSIDSEHGEPRGLGGRQY